MSANPRREREAASAPAEVELTLNGEPIRLPARTCIDTLLEQRGIPRKGIAVAINRQVVPRARYGDHVIRDGDVVDVVQAVGGG